jgi:hypothetical protein
MKKARIYSNSRAACVANFIIATDVGATEADKGDASGDMTEAQDRLRQSATLFPTQQCFDAVDLRRANASNILLRNERSGYAATIVAQQDLYASLVQEGGRQAS